MSDDPRRNHPGWEDPAPKKQRQTLGVRLLDSLRPGPKSEKGASQDPWVQRIAALTVLVGATSAAGWGGHKITEKSDTVTSAEAKELKSAIARLDGKVTRLTEELEKKEKREAKEAEEVDLLIRRQLVQAHAIHMLNGRVAPVYGWPEPRFSEWISGTDNLHRHVRTGGRYPGTKD